MMRQNVATLVLSRNASRYFVFESTSVKMAP
jgi:hypothetical protein